MSAVGGVVVPASRSSLEGAERSEAPLCQTKQAGQPSPLVDQLRRAVATAKGSRCPSVRTPAFAFSKGTGLAYEIPCGSWGCSAHCAHKKKAAARLAIEIGMDRAWAQGRRIRFMTLTDGSAGAMSVADLYKAWNRLRVKLRRMNVLDQYAAVVETQQRGALHLHVLQAGSYIHQADLVRLASAAGFGRIVDIRAVDRSLPSRDRRSASYVAKDLARYASKSGADLAGKANVRRRPVRFSRFWGCSLRQAELLVAEQIRIEFDLPEDPGPWIVVRKAPDGSLLPPKGYQSDDPAEQLPRAIPPLAARRTSARQRGEDADEKGGRGAKLRQRRS